MALIASLIAKFLAATSGYKTILSFVGWICYAIYLLFAKSNGTPVTDDVSAAIQAILTGLSVIGIGHKVQKVNESLDKNTQAVLTNQKVS